VVGAYAGHAAGMFAAIALAGDGGKAKKGTSERIKEDTKVL
jgi:hypothetical protein